MFSKRLSKLHLRSLVSTRSSPRQLKKKLNLQTIPFDQTLTGRLFIYLNKNNKFTTNTTQSMLSKQDILRKIHNFSIDELENSIVDLQSSWRDDAHEGDVLNSLDSISCVKLNMLTMTNILRLLGIFMFVTPANITECNFYNLAIKQLNVNMFSLSKDELLKLLFFVALQKKSRFTKNWVEKCLERLQVHLEDLSIEEVCVICNSTFKTSTKIENTAILNKVKQIVVDNVIILNDPSIFITLIKTIRHNRCQDESTLSAIGCAFCFNKTYHNYAFGGLCHILALYADYFYFDKKLFDVSVEKCLNFLTDSNMNEKPIETYLTQRIRTKDITRFLWILSNVNYKLNINNFDYISCKIMERIALKEYTKDPDELAACALYLWMLNYQALDIIKYYFLQNYVEIGANSKYRLRFNLLLSCIRRENPNLYSEIKVKPIDHPILSANEMKQQIGKRPSLERVLNALKAKSHSLELNKFEYTCEIPYLNIVGITGFKKRIYKSLYIEVLDEYTTLKNTENTENGPMALKIRLLNKMNEGVLKVKECSIEAMTEKQLEDYLKSEIKLLC